MQLAKLIESTKDLPTLPAVATQINEETKKKSLTAHSLGKIIAQDPSLTSKLLRLANSAYYGLARQVETPQRAITVLGLNTIQSLALSVSVFKLFSSDSEKVIDLQGLWCHSLGVAVSSKAITMITQPELAEKAFVGGILHDIGKIIIAHKIPDAMREILKLMKDSDINQADAESKVLGYSHPRVGAMLAESWNFPEDYVNAVRKHHKPFLPKEISEKKEATLINSIYVGNMIAKAAKLGVSTDQKMIKIDVEILKYLDLSNKKLPDLLKEIKTQYDGITESWDLG
ncbi:MAG: HDOD domain-containing protein [Proteobacteria bacterium]|nr:HDOD domain-containing protein [Pseudomonadota bacterium]MBU1709358.1 HDOD domain-containing protein [Pseudomonadota bacterium]